VTRFHLLGQLPLFLAVLLAIVAGTLCFYLYRREVSLSESRSAGLLPWLRAIAVALIVFMLTEPALQHRKREGTPGKLTIVIDDSESMSLKDGHASNRYQRAIDQLLNAESELLTKLAAEHDMRVVRASSAQSVELWSATLEEQSELPASSTDWLVKSFHARTELGDFVDRDDSTVLVLLTDGQVNHGQTFLEAAQKKSNLQTIFTVGFGPDVSPPELSILSVEHPDRLFRRDRLAGKVVLNDSMPADKSFQLTAFHGEEVVWQQSLRTEGKGQRAIAFNFAIEPLVQKLTSSKSDESSEHAKTSAVPLAIRFQISGDPVDSMVETPSYDIRLWGALHRSRILMVDGRSRWEARYLKNAFERDPFWEIVPVIAESDDILATGPRFPIGENQPQFPMDRDELMKFDLIILGDFPLDLLSNEQQQWLVDFVSESGGGLVIVDGQRDEWSKADRTIVGQLLPVERLSDDRTKSKVVDEAAAKQDKLAYVNLTSIGRSLAALDIRDDERNNAAESWKALPPLQWYASTRSMRGTEVLASLHNESATSADENLNPFLATRLNGAGRVLYFASDETWRWRYKLADKVHQRFWNQMARWAMRTPYLAESEFASLDAGRMNYQEGEPIEIRSRLRKNGTTPLKDAEVQALIERDGQPPIMINLTPNQEIPGVYNGTAMNLPSGNYRVKVSANGVPREMLDIATEFNVTAKPSIELNEKSADVVSLKRLAESTGGKHLKEGELSNLIDLLQPYSQGKIIETETLLWQSYFWFLPVVTLLAIEWLLRKRLGLI
jgi:uncharacterized membrane protein